MRKPKGGTVVIVGHRVPAELDEIAATALTSLRAETGHVLREAPATPRELLAAELKLGLEAHVWSALSQIRYSRDLRRLLAQAMTNHLAGWLPRVLRDAEQDARPRAN